MAYKICIPGGGATLDVGPYRDVPAAVRARTTMWGDMKWGGLSLVIVNDETGREVDVCRACRGAGGIAVGDDVVDCEPCGGHGVKG